MCLSKSHPSRQETMQIQNQIYAPEVRFKWNLHALIHKSNPQNSHLLPRNTHTFTSNNSGVRNVLFDARAEGSQPYQN